MLIDEIQKRTGCAVIIIEHRVEDVLYRPVDRVVLMGDGRIRYDGDPDALLCSSLLQESGIREPLYVTALKYAGVTLMPDMRPSYLPELNLSPEQREQVLTWFSRQPPAPAEPEREVLLPILGVIRAGIPTLAQQEVLGHASADVSEPERYFYLRVMGDSMSGAGIHDGDLVLIRQQDWADSGQIIACVVGGEDATLKRFHRQGDTVILQPENPAYQPRLVPVSDFDCGRARIVGVAVRLVREL